MEFTFGNQHRSSCIFNTNNSFFKCRIIQIFLKPVSYSNASAHLFAITF